MHISVGELVRLLPDALRGLGFSYPLADRATHMVVWGEVVHGLGLPFLAEHGEEIEAATRTGFGLDESAVGETRLDTLDARGKSMLEAGPRALDLAQGRAGSTAPAVCLLDRTLGAFLAGELAERALSRGLVFLAAIRGDAASRYEGQGVLVAVPGMPGGAIRSASLELLSAPNAAGLFEALGVKPADAPRLLSVMGEFLAGPTQGTRMAVLAVHPSGMAQGAEARIADMLAAAPRAEGWLTLTDFATARRTALRDGLHVEDDGWSALGGYVGRTRVPTSERSRSQAG